MVSGLVRLLRRSVALALALCAVWVVLRTSGLPDSAQALHVLTQDAVLAVGLLRAQLPAARQAVPPQDGLTPLQRLVVAQSPLLRNAVIGDTPPTPAAPAPTTAPEPENTDEDLTQPNLAHSETSPIIPRTFVPSQAQTYLQTGDIYIANRAGKQVDVDALVQTGIGFSLGEGPQILILHSHATEAYSQDSYTPTDPYRTTDCDHNMVRVGEEMARAFRSAGLEVIHDTTLYDYPSYNDAYDRSLAAAERWLTQYPSIQVILDVHRDALVAEDDSIYKAVCVEQGEDCAQVMLVVGTDGTGKYHPLWQENLSFAMALQRRLLDDYDQLARPMVLRASRFNQHLRPGSVLVEVGTHGNSLQEALRGARLFAQSAAQALK